MPNTQAKERKRRKVRINAELKSNGRTRRQTKKKKMKDAVNSYKESFDGTIDEQYKSMHQDIAGKNRVARAIAEANRNSKEGE
jgi:hypothetical protein